MADNDYYLHPGGNPGADTSHEDIEDPRVDDAPEPDTDVLELLDDAENVCDSCGLPEADEYPLVRVETCVCRGLYCSEDCHLQHHDDRHTTPEPLPRPVRLMEEEGF